MRTIASNTRTAVLVTLLGLMTFVNSATAAEATTTPKKLRVVTTIFPIYCFASGVIGSEGQVQNLLPANVGPHDYQLSPSDIRKIKEADVVVINALGLDNWVMKAIDTNKNRLISLGALLNTTNLIDIPADLDMEGKHQHGHEHQHGPANPHIWLDPQLAMQCVDIISNAVVHLNPAYK